MQQVQQKMLQNQVFQKLGEMSFMAGLGGQAQEQFKKGGVDTGPLAGVPPKPDTSAAANQGKALNWARGYAQNILGRDYAADQAQYRRTIGEGAALYTMGGEMRKVYQEAMGDLKSDPFTPDEIKAFNSGQMDNAALLKLFDSKVADFKSAFPADAHPEIDFVADVQRKQLKNLPTGVKRDLQLFWDNTVNKIWKDRETERNKRAKNFFRINPLGDEPI
jgi:hypothetical protein